MIKNISSIIKIVLVIVVVIGLISLGILISNGIHSNKELRRIKKKQREETKRYEKLYKEYQKDIDHIDKTQNEIFQKWINEQND